MRIIAGKRRGLKLETLFGDNTRPTLDRVREALFSMLGGTCDHLEVLDLFAGSGSLGLEALSRNAKAVTFVDKHQEAYRVLKKNIDRMNMADQTTSVCQEAIQFLKQTRNQFDLIFLDPPYQNTILNDVLVLLQTKCHDGAIVVIETDGSYPLIIPKQYQLKNTRQYGRVQLTIIQYHDAHCDFIQ